MKPTHAKRIKRVNADGRTKRIKLELTPGSIHQLKVLATGQQPPPKIACGAAAAKVFAAQFLRCAPWNPRKTCERWHHPPGANAIEKYLAGEAKSGEVTPGLLPGDRLDAIVAGLYWHHSVLNAPLHQIPALDKIVLQTRHEVLDVLLPAARAELERWCSRLLTVSKADWNVFFWAASTAIERISAAMQHGSIPPPSLVQDFLGLLELTGLRQPLQSHLKPIDYGPPPPEAVEAEIVQVPHCGIAFERLRGWSHTTGLNRKSIATAILESALAKDDDPIERLNDLFEYAILRDDLEMLRALFNLLRDYQSRIDAELCPFPDAGLSTFLLEVRCLMRQIEDLAKMLESVLPIAMAARWAPDNNARALLRQAAANVYRLCAQADCRLQAPERLALAKLLLALKPMVKAA